MSIPTPQRISSAIDDSTRCIAVDSKSNYYISGGSRNEPIVYVTNSSWELIRSFELDNVTQIWGIAVDAHDHIIVTIKIPNEILVLTNRGNLISKLYYNKVKLPVSIMGVKFYDVKVEQSTNYIYITNNAGPMLLFSSNYILLQCINLPGMNTIKSVAIMNNTKDNTNNTILVVPSFSKKMIKIIEQEEEKVDNTRSRIIPVYNKYAFKAGTNFKYKTIGVIVEGLTSPTSVATYKSKETNLQYIFVLEEHSKATCKVYKQQNVNEFKFKLVHTSYPTKSFYSGLFHCTRSESMYFCAFNDCCIMKYNLSDL